MHKQENEIKNLHQVSWRGLWNILLIRGTFRKLPFILSILITLITISILAATRFPNLFEVVKVTAESILSFFPDLLGFSLGGFAIVVGFSNVELIKKSSRLDKPSVYQILNSVFAYCIIVQIIVTILAFVVHWYIENDISNIIPNNDLCCAFNLLLLAILIFGSLFTLLLTPVIIINLFTLSQMNNVYYTLEKKKEAEETKKETL